MDAFEKFYKGGKQPADAVRLAIADHRKVNGPQGGSIDFIDSLIIAAQQCEDYDKQRLALTLARNSLLEIAKIELTPAVRRRLRTALEAIEACES